MKENIIAVLIDEKYKDRSLPSLFKACKRISGFPKVILSKVVAIRLAEDSFLVESSVIDEILDSCTLETVWSLASGTDNPILRAKCMEKLDGYIENDNNVEYEKQKMSKKMIEMVFGEYVDEDKLVDREEGVEFYYDKFKGR